MNIIAGAFPLVDKNEKDIEEKFKIAILKLLNEKYGITEQDLTSAELNLVSGLEPRYVGFDKAIIGGGRDTMMECVHGSVSKLLWILRTPLK